MNIGSDIIIHSKNNITLITTTTLQLILSFLALVDFSLAPPDTNPRVWTAAVPKLVPATGLVPTDHIDIPSTPQNRWTNPGLSPWAAVPGSGHQNGDYGRVQQSVNTKDQDKAREQEYAVGSSQLGSYPPVGSAQETWNAGRESHPLKQPASFLNGVAATPSDTATNGYRKQQYPKIGEISSMICKHRK